MISREVIEKETAGLSDNHLFDLARNVSAPKETRKFAAEVLLEKGAYQASKPEISGLIEEIKAAHEEADAVPYAQHETESAQQSDEFAAHSSQPIIPAQSASFLTSSAQ